MEPGAVRDRLTRGLDVKNDTNDIAVTMEAAFVQAVAAEELHRKLDRAEREGKIRRVLGRDWMSEAKALGILTAAEAERLTEANRLAAKIIAVDHFDPSEITGKPSFGHNSRKAMPAAQAAE